MFFTKDTFHYVVERNTSSQILSCRSEKRERRGRKSVDNHFRRVSSWMGAFSLQKNSRRDLLSCRRLLSKKKLWSGKYLLMIFFIFFDRFDVWIEFCSLVNDRLHFSLRVRKLRYLRKIESSIAINSIRSYSWVMILNFCDKICFYLMIFTL